MLDKFLILTINPGSTSTKVAIFENEQLLIQKNIKHETKELEAFQSVYEQLDFRTNCILQILEEEKIDGTKLHAISARGGLVRPIPSGTYEIDEWMLDDLKNQKLGQHASNLGAPIAKSLSEKFHIPCYIVDPVVVDEMDSIARISGFKYVQRKSLFHALNQKAVAKRYAKEVNRPYESLRLVVCHMGGGITVGAHAEGRVIDVNNGLDGEGPFTPERTGTIPAGDLVHLCFSGELTKDQIMKAIVGQGGLVGLLGTNNALEIEERIHNGDTNAQLVYEAMAYQVAKEIASFSAVLKGELDAVIITGGLAHSNLLIQWIKERIHWIGEIVVIPGEDEMLALCQGALRVLIGQEEAKNYEQSICHELVSERYY